MLANITQQELASSVGVTAQQVQKYEYGASRISAAQLFRVTKAAGISMGRFFEDLPYPGVALGRMGMTNPDCVDEAPLEHRNEIELIRAFRRLRDDKVRQWVLKLLSMLEGLPESGVSSDGHD